MIHGCTFVHSDMQMYTEVLVIFSLQFILIGRYLVCNLKEGLRKLQIHLAHTFICQGTGRGQRVSDFTRPFHDSSYLFPQLP